MKSWIRIAVLCAATLAVHTPVFAGMIITSSYVYTELYTSRTTYSNAFTGTVFPASPFLDTTAGANYSRNQINHTQSAGGETLSYDLSQKRDGGSSDHSYSSGNMLFKVDANTTYKLSGFLNATHVGSPGRVLLYAYLFDGFDILSESYSLSGYTANESLALGTAGGDEINIVSGSLTGNLVTGKDYVFNWEAYIQEYPSADAGGSAVGNITLTTGSGGAVVPEPASIAIWGIGALGMGLVVRRKKRHTVTA